MNGVPQGGADVVVLHHAGELRVQIRPRNTDEKYRNTCNIELYY